MVSSNKILTVSYGTFSCTLEGFDNSFDTMKAIAEYFRDLAQDDRYFGAEPPTPDAEMLARIAEREIERRVEARFEKGNLVLRPTDDADTPPGDVATEQSSGAALVGATAGLAATGLAVADTSLDIADDVTPVEDDEVEIDLSELSLDAAKDDEPEDITSEVDTHALDDLGLSTADEEDETDLSSLSAMDDDDDAQSIDELISEQENDSRSDAEAPVEEDTVAEDVTPVADPSDSVAEKLQRIRAVVASKAQEEPEEPEYIEDEHAMSGPDGDGYDENDAIDVAAHVPGFEDDADDAPTADTANADGPLDAEDENIFADTIAAIVSDQIEAEEEPVTTEKAASSDTVEDTSSELEALRAKIALLEAQAASAKAAPADTETDVEHLEFEEHDAPDAADDENNIENHDAEEAAEDGPLVLENAVEEQTVQPVAARVNKAKRADVEAALAAGAIEEFEDGEEEELASDATASVPGAEKSSLTAEQEAELARELAELQAEIDEDDDWNFDTEDDDTDTDAAEDDAPTLSDEDEEAAEANIRKAVKLTSPARAMLTDKAIEEDDDSVDRLIGQTETEMDEPEGNRRRSAIAHLRAAVAATKADRLLGIGKKDKDEEEPYREDLADAVRPRRPKVATTKSERPAPVRPAPLKLVAEQRIDAEDAEGPTEPVRPRRVRRAEPVDAPEAVAGNDTGFAEFAENQGANTLPELLEAAAAYMSFVEGRDQFSRPQLMTKIHQAEGEASSREERLRSFGQLLRDGKIEKKGGGRFAASDSIGFKPNSRAAG